MSQEALFESLSLGSEVTLLLLPFVVVLYYVARMFKGEKVLLIVVGTLFLWALSHFSFLSIGIIFALSVINFLLLRRLQRVQRVGNIGLAFIINLSALIFLKYLPSEEVNTYTHMANMGDFVGIVGLSFYVFHVWSAFVDVRHNRVESPVEFMTFMTYLLYFPKIITGPLVRYNEFDKELKNSSSSPLNEPWMMAGVGLLLMGLLKKAAGDYLSLYPMAVYANASGYGGFEHLLAMYGYALYIFLDFSGYTDMARGISRLFGIELPQNFASPYRATSMTEFWRRWHMTLSLWIRDYIYIPFGGSKYGTLRTQFNVMIAFILSGVWHGVGIGYAIWGAMHGGGVVLNKLLGKKIVLLPLFGWLLTFHWVCFGWIFFANPYQEALVSLTQIATDFRWDMVGSVLSNNVAWGIALVCAFVYSLWDEIIVTFCSTLFSRLYFPVKVGVFLIVLALVIASHALGVNLFIYQNF